MPEEPDNLISLPRKGEPAAPGGAATESPAAGRQRRAGDSTIDRADLRAVFAERLAVLDLLDVKRRFWDGVFPELERIKQIDGLTIRIRNAFEADTLAEQHDLLVALAVRAMQLDDEITGEDPRRGA